MSFWDALKTPFTDQGGGKGNSIEGEGIGKKNKGGGILGFKRKYLDKIGDPLNIFGHMKSGIEDYISGAQAEDVKAAYDKAMADAQASGQRTKDFLMGRLGVAQGYYQPMQDMFNRTYGAGLDAPQVPQAPRAGVLNGMYGGGR